MWQRPGLWERRRCSKDCLWRTLQAQGDQFHPGLWLGFILLTFPCRGWILFAHLILSLSVCPDCSPGWNSFPEVRSHLRRSQWSEGKGQTLGWEGSGQTQGEERKAYRWAQGNMRANVKYDFVHLKCLPRSVIDFLLKSNQSFLLIVCLCRSKWRPRERRQSCVRCSLRLTVCRWDSNTPRVIWSRPKPVTSPSTCRYGPAAPQYRPPYWYCFSFCCIYILSNWCPAGEVQAWEWVSQLWPSH